MSSFTPMIIISINKERGIVKLRVMISLSFRNYRNSCQRNFVCIYHAIKLFFHEKYNFPFQHVRSCFHSTWPIKQNRLKSLLKISNYQEFFSFINKRANFTNFPNYIVHLTFTPNSIPRKCNRSCKSRHFFKLKQSE